MSNEESEYPSLKSCNKKLGLYKSAELLSKHLENENIPFIRRGVLDDALDIFELYKKVSSAYPDSLAQQTDEINLSYVKSIIKDAYLRGLILVMFDKTILVGFLKGSTSEFRRKAHILTNVTMMIDPSAVGQGLGTELLKAYQDELQKSFQHIRLMELLPYNSNSRGIRLYEKMGFSLTATLPGKIRYIDGTFGDQLLMNWINPNFSYQVLLEYHQSLQNLLSEI